MVDTHVMRLSFNIYRAKELTQDMGTISRARISSAGSSDSWIHFVCTLWLDLDRKFEREPTMI